MSKVGTTCSGVYPRRKSNGAKHVPNPIPAAESIISNKNANIIISKINSNINSPPHKKI